MSVASTYISFSAILFRDLKLGFRNSSDLLNPLLFFLIVVTMFPLALGPDKLTLQQNAPAVIWVAAVLASSVSLDMMFRTDFEDGSLEQMLLSPQPAIILIMAKILAHWLMTGAPLTIFALLLGMLLYLPMDAILPLSASLLIGTHIFSLVGSVGVALTVGLRGSGMLLALLILPLYMPVLIFAVAAVNNSLKGLSVSGEFYFLFALLILAFTLAPFATVASLRIRMG
jgi:heme exporter protein B